MREVFQRYPKTSLYFFGAVAHGTGISAYGCYENCSRYDTPSIFASKVAQSVLLYPVAVAMSLPWPAYVGKRVFDFATGIEYK